MRSHLPSSPKWLMLVPILILVAIVAVACGDDATPTTAPTSTPVAGDAPDVSGGEPKYGGIVPMSVTAASAVFDPHIAPSNENIAVYGPIYDQVVWFNPLDPTEIIGDLAKTWEVGAGATSYTFRLNEGVKWHDGTAFSADDVVFSIKRMTQEGEARPRVGRLIPYVKDAVAVDPNTVRVDLNFPSGAFLKLLASDYMKVLPKHLSDAGTDYNIHSNMIGTGPFKPVSISEGVSWENEKNPDYFKDGRPFFDGIKGLVISDVGTEIAALKTERVLMPHMNSTMFSVDDALRVLDDPDFTSKATIYWQEIGGDGQYITLNNQIPPFDNADLRRAIFLAVDRQAMQEGFGRGFYKPGAPMKPQTSDPFALPEAELLALPGYRQLDGAKHPDDIAEARRLFNLAAPNGLKTEMRAFVWSFFPDMAQALQAQLQEALPGLELTLNVQEVSTFFGTVWNGDTTMTFTGLGPMVVDPDDRFSALYVKEGGFNAGWVGWADPAVDDLFDRQQREADTAERIRLSHEMQRTVLGGSPGIIETTWAAFPLGVSKRIMTEAGQYVVSNSIHHGQKHDHEWLEPK